MFTNKLTGAVTGAWIVDMQIVEGTMIALVMVVGAAVLLVGAMLAVAFLTERRAVSEAQAVLRQAAQAARPSPSSDTGELRLR
jgi:uncharacterized membrane protein HdeD (DUF308 family)